MSYNECWCQPLWVHLIWDTVLSGHILSISFTMWRKCSVIIFSNKFLIFCFFSFSDTTPPPNTHTYLLEVILHFLLPQPFASANVLSVFMDLHILDILYKTNYTLCDLLYSVFSISIMFLMFICIYIFSFWNISICMCIPWSIFFPFEIYPFVCVYHVVFIHSLIDGHLGCFHFFGYYK